jgi:hypothetical protein
VFHGQNIFGDLVTGMRADNGDSEDFIGTRFGQDPDGPIILAVGNGSIEVVNAIVGDLLRDVLFLGFQNVKSDRGTSGAVTEFP